MQKSVAVLAVAQRTVRLITTVGESFGGNSKAQRAKDIQHGRTGKADQDDVAVPESDAFGNRFREIAIVDGLVVQSAMGLYVDDARAEPVGDPRQSFDLLVYKAGHRIGGQTQLEASEVFAIGIAGMSADGDTVAYTVDWGDGTTPQKGVTTGSTTQGAAVTMTHVFPDSFTSTSRSATALITATDFRAGGTAAAQQRVFLVTYNALPTANITSPQASLTPPSQSDLPSGALPGFVNPAGTTDPDIVVIPNGASLRFAATATPPTSSPLSQVSLFTGLGSSCSQALLEKRPSNTEGSGRKLISSGGGLPCGPGPKSMFFSVTCRG